MQDDRGPYFYLIDAPFSTLALIDLSGDLVERVDYEVHGYGGHRSGLFDCRDDELCDGFDIMMQMC